MSCDVTTEGGKERRMRGKDTSYSSIWLYEKNNELPELLQDTIATPIGRGSPTGGGIYSEFNPTNCRKVVSYWSEVGDLILDPFAGRTRAFMSVLMGRRYIGFEIQEQVCSHLLGAFNRFTRSSLFPTDATIRIINDDSFNIENHNLPLCDMVFTCPPYWNRETYNGGDGDLSGIGGYDDFLRRYRAILQKSLGFLRNGKYMVLVVGDFRVGGVYYPFHSDTLQELKDCGNIKLHDIVCMQSVTFDIANFRFGQFSGHKIVSKVHEYILVYKKVDG